MKEKNYLEVEQFCLAQGADLFGVADISGIKKEFKLSEKVLSKLDKAISLGVRLSGAILEEIADSPTPAYSYHYKTVNLLLDQIALKASNYIQNKGFLALPIASSQILDWKNYSGHLSHRHIGTLAGLGWIGRNNLLVNIDFGSQFRLATVLTNMPLTVDEPCKDNCGTCRLCMLQCPAGAIKENPKDFNHQSCSSKIKEFQKMPLINQYICGICVNACKGKKA